MKKLKLGKRIRNSKPVRATIRWSKKNSLPGFEGLSLYTVFRFILDELKKDNILIRANAMAFSFFIALFPSIIVLFTLLPYLPIQNLTATVKESVMQLLPMDAAIYVIDVINSLTTVTNSGLLSFSLFLTLLFASNGMLTMMRGFEKSYHVSYKSRSIISKRLTAIRLTFIVGSIFVFSILFIVVGRVILDVLLEWTHIDKGRFIAILILRWVAILILFYGGISAAYRYGPGMHEKIRFFSPGATLATILSVISSIIFSYYVSRFGRYNELYGSLGAIIILMLWIQINSLVILIGYELNASIKINRDLRASQDEASEVESDAPSVPQR